MKIGILTWFFAYNYGARAHSLALLKYLKSQGHECVFINYLPNNAKRINFRGAINCSNPKRHPVLVAKCLLRCLKFKTIKRCYPATKPIYNANGINLCDIDLLIIGSDAIMNVKHPLFSPVYFGHGVTLPFITYAPSCEYLDIKSVAGESYFSSISNAKLLSGRDYHTVDLLKTITKKEVELVVDPTFLFDFSGLSVPPKYENYILVYCFSDWNSFSSAIRDFAKRNSKRIISVGRYCSWADVSFSSVSFQKWIGFFEKASFVFTDSFHGVCFSIKNKKQMIVASRDDKKDKIEQLFSYFSMPFEFYSENQPIECYLEKNKIDYSACESQINKRIEESKYYLSKAINNEIK